MSELKPCPFCGKRDAEIMYCDPNCPCDGSVREVYCVNCDASIPVESEKEAIAAWNTRPIEDKLQAELESANDCVVTLSEGLSGAGEEIERLEKEAEKHPPYPVYGEARSRLLASIKCSTIDEAIQKYKKLAEEKNDLLNLCLERYADLGRVRRKLSAYENAMDWLNSKYPEVYALMLIATDEDLADTKQPRNDSMRYILTEIEQTKRYG